MDETDGWLVLGILALMSAGMWLQRRRLDLLEADVAFLRDVSRVTDAARSDR